MHEFQFYWQPFDCEEIYTADAVYWPPVKASGEFWGAKYDDSDPPEITITRAVDREGKRFWGYEEEEIVAAAFEAYEKQLQEID